MIEKEIFKAHGADAELDLGWYAVCDECGRPTGSFRSRKNLREYMFNAGWTTRTISSSRGIVGELNVCSRHGEGARIEEPLEEDR